MTRSRLLPAAVCTVLLLGACAGTSGTATSPTTPVSVTELFAGSLTPGGAAFYSFTVTNAGTVAVTLASTATESVTTAAGTAPRISVSADAGSYCVQVFDVDSTAVETPFSVTIEHP